MTSETASELRANGRETIRSSLATHLPIKVKRPVSQWANEERWIARGASPLSQARDIRYDVGVMPWCREPMDSAGDPDVQVTALQWASGMAKTEVVVNIIGHSIHEAPKNIFVFYPKDESRDKFSRDVLQRSLIDTTPAVRALVAEQRTRESANTIQYKRFAGGSIYAVGSGSASNFRGPRAGVVYGDEIDGMPDSVGGAQDGEGDPIFLAFKRAEGFANAIKILSGTPTYERDLDKDGKIVFNSRIDQWMFESDYRKWFAPCRSCSSWHVWSFEHIVAPKGQPERAEILCPACAAAHSDRQRVESVMAGQWRATQPFRGIRGYWIDGVSTTLPAEKGFRSKLHQMVADAERAARDPESKKVWVNTFLAKCVKRTSEEQEPPPWEPIYQRRERYADETRVALPLGALVLTAFTDVQRNRLEVEWRAWGRKEISWGVEHAVIHGDPMEAETWDALNEQLQRTFPRADGSELRLSIGLVDAAWASDQVYYYVQRLARNPVPGVSRIVFASRGIGQHGHPVVDLKYKTIAKNLKGYHIGTWGAKKLIYERLAMEEPDKEGFMHYSHRYSESFFEQLTAEKPSITWERGQEITKFENPGQKRNEALDLAVGNLAAFRKLRIWDFGPIEKALAEQADAKRRPEQPAKAETPTYRPQSNFATKGIRWR